MQKKYGVEISKDKFRFENDLCELVVGFYKAGKEEQRYQKVLFLLVTSIALVVVLLETVRMCWFVKITEELVDKEGDAGVAGYYKVIVGCYIGVCVRTICETLATVVPALDVIEGSSNQLLQLDSS